MDVGQPRHAAPQHHVARRGDGRHDERYTYDRADRLIESRRGTLDGSNLISGSNVARIGDWSLDAQGNWGQYWAVDDPHAGDVDLDGSVGFADQTIVSQHYNETGYPQCKLSPGRVVNP